MNAQRVWIAVAMVLTCAAMAGADDSWVGQKVMKRKPEVKFGERDDDGQKYFPLEGVVWQVLKEKDGWLRLRGDDGKEGWTLKEEFVLLVDAPGFYTDLIKADEKSAWTWTMRGLAWHQKGELENAIKDYTEAIRLNPKYATAFLNRGSAWHGKKEYDKAIKDSDEAIRIDPKNAAAFFNLGTAWGDKKEYDKAIKDYSEAIRLDPKDASSFYNRGNTWGDMKEYDKAIKDYSEAIRLDPKDAKTFLNRGIAWGDKNKHDKAIKDYTEAIRLNPKYTLAFCWRGGAYLISRSSKAIADYKSVLEIEGWKGDWSTYATILGHLSCRFDKDEDSANQFLTKAEGKLDEAWPYPVVKYLRGDLDEPALMELATDDDKRTEARCYLGLDLLLKGKQEKAREHFLWIKEKGSPSFIEHTIAIAELARLDKAKDK